MLDRLLTEARYQSSFASASSPPRPVLPGFSLELLVKNLFDPCLTEPHLLSSGAVARKSR